MRWSVLVLLVLWGTAGCGTQTAQTPLPAPASEQSLTPIPVAGPTGDASSTEDAYAEVGQPPADEVGTARAAEFYGYGRCRPVEDSLTADLSPTLRNGKWITMDSAQAGDWLAPAQTAPCPTARTWSNCLISTKTSM